MELRNIHGPLRAIDPVHATLMWEGVCSSVPTSVTEWLRGPRHSGTELGSKFPRATHSARVIPRYSAIPHFITIISLFKKNIYKEAYEITLLCVCVSALTFEKNKKRFRILPCCLCVCLYPTNFFVFYEVSVISKEYKWLVTHRTSCMYNGYNFSLTPRSWVLLEKQAAPHLLKDFPTFRAIHKFITAFTTAWHWSLFWTKGLQSTPHSISLRSILILSFHLRLNLHNGLFPSWIPTKILYAFLLEFFTRCENIICKSYHGFFGFGTVLSGRWSLTLQKNMGDEDEGRMFFRNVGTNLPYNSEEENMYHHRHEKLKF
jgi:hypothetical protein